MSDSFSLVWSHSVHFAKFPILRFSKRYFSNSFHRIPSKLYQNIAYYGGMQAITLLGNRPSFSTLESMGKPKMWSISKREDRRVKRTKIWDSWYYNTYMDVTFDAWFFEFGLGSFSALCKISRILQCLKTLLLSQFSSDSSKLYTRSGGQYRLLRLWWCAKNFKKMALWIFLNIGSYAAGNFKVLFLPQFSLEPIQTLWQHWLPW